MKYCSTYCQRYNYFYRVVLFKGLLLTLFLLLFCSGRCTTTYYSFFCNGFIIPSSFVYHQQQQQRYSTSTGKTITSRKQFNQQQQQQQVVSTKYTTAYLKLQSRYRAPSVPFVFSLASFVLRSSNNDNNASTVASAEEKEAAVIEQELEQETRSMSIRELKQELTKLKVSTNGIFEKEELIQRLIVVKKQSRSRNLDQIKSGGGSSSNESNTATDDKADIIQARLYFTSLTDSSARTVAARNGGGIVVNPTEQPYATIKITNINGNNDRTLSLLLDTACTGFVLRPEVVNRYQLPKLQTPVTMTSAGGTNSATGLTQISSFTIDNAIEDGMRQQQQNKLSRPRVFGPLPAAVQDIGGLPSSLDGIIGLSFLNQFSMIEFDFMNNIVSFCSSSNNNSKKRQFTNQNSVGETHLPPLVAQDTMQMLPRLGIYTVDAYLGDRGPVKMLVDTGASCTILNWVGIQQLGLSRSSPAVSPLATAMGAMGSDNVAIQLTHRLYVSSKINFVNKNQSNTNKELPGLSLQGKRLAIDIGRIPILDSLQSEGVGGILGVDVLMRSSVIRISCKEPKEITLYSDA